MCTLQGEWTIHDDDVDGALIRLVLRNRDEVAFRNLYERHTPRLLRFVLRLTAGSEAEDIVQESWVRAVETLGDFGQRSNLSTWLHGIALNVVRERRRRRERTNRAAEIGDLRTPDPVVRDGDPEARIDLERGLSCLPEGRRMVLVLHDLYGHTHREVADMLEISVGTSKSQLHDARRQLESLLRRKDVK